VIRRLALILALTAMAVLALGAGQAVAAKSCANKIIDDWYKDGRVDGTYELHCYEEAINSLPEDVRQYSSAREDIERALQAALRSGAPTGTPGGGSGGSSGGSGTSTTGSGGKERPTGSKTTTTSTGTGTTSTTGDDGTLEAAPGDESSDASSVPLPLIVLGGLALLLLAAGGAGYLNRRMQARRADGGPTDPPADL
jgi:cobalamin biosynthesis Mg chelatase CobN